MEENRLKRCFKGGGGETVTPGGGWIRLSVTGVGCGDLKGGWNFRIFPVRTEKVSMEFRRGGILLQLDEFCFTTSRKNLF
jgi:hypothetical protein